MYSQLLHDDSTLTGKFEGGYCPYEIRSWGPELCIVWQSRKDIVFDLPWRLQQRQWRFPPTRQNLRCSSVTKRNKRFAKIFQHMKNVLFVHLNVILTTWKEHFPHFCCLILHSFRDAPRCIHAPVTRNSFLSHRQCLICFIGNVSESHWRPKMDNL
jgi:hypothetical protein